MKFSVQITAAAGVMAFVFLLAIFGCSSPDPLAPAAESGPAAPILGAGPDSGPRPDSADTLTFVGTFETGRNEGGWSYYTPHKAVFEDLGGNPDGYLHDDDVVSFAPHPGTELGGKSRFTGDYRARRVVTLGVDLRSLNYQWDVASRYVALKIMNDAGTPLDPEDDWGAYIVGPDKVPSKYLEMKSDAEKNAPGWKNYDFAIASQANGPPAGWNMIRPPAGDWAKTQLTWGNLMADVSYVQFWYGDPTLVYFLNEFDLGLDNPRIAWEEAR